MNASAAVADFLDFERFVRGIAPKSAGLYAHYLKHFLRLAGPESSLAAASGRAEAFLGSLGARGVGDHARAKAFTILRSFFRWACDHSQLEQNPLAKSRPPIIRTASRLQHCPSFLGCPSAQVRSSPSAEPFSKAVAIRRAVLSGSGQRPGGAAATDSTRRWPMGVRRRSRKVSISGGLVMPGRVNSHPSRRLDIGRNP
ncbi:MAG TPA: hypothetical protein DEB40_08660 [Elusimicrobia bacterium]|nr:hypothetical protein [Elusimicrobiota bacterium]HBT61799.1 hypothetical protein [Elusimicrobiota bacterium]